jgi:hypothetical protein
MQLSLRGSLAQQYFDLASQGALLAAEIFVRSLIESLDPDLDKRVDGDLLVIGKVSERGQFSPDW